MASRRTLQRRLLTALTGVVMAAMTTPGVAAVPGGCGVACLVPVRLERLGRDAAVVHLPPDVPHSAAAAKFDVPTGLPEVAHVAVTLFTDAVTAQPLATTDPDGRLGALVALFRDVPTPAWQAALGETAPGAEMAATALFLAPQGPWRLPVPPGAAGGGPPVQVPQAFMLVRPAAGWPFDRVLMHGAATLRHGLRPRPGLLAEATVEVVDGPRAVVAAGSFAGQDGLYFRAVLPPDFAPSAAQRSAFLAALAHALGSCITPG